MTDQEMMDLLRKIDVGTEVIIGSRCIDGSIKAIRGKFMGDLRPHGFYGNGSWGLCKTNSKEAPCYRFCFMMLGARSKCMIPKIGFDVDYIKLLEQ